MKEYHSVGTICTKGPYFLECAVCQIEYIEKEDGSTTYIFTPNYSVIDLLDYRYFDGIPGLDLDLRKERYVRSGFVPSFISERVPQKNRVDYLDLLKEVGLEIMDPIEYLIRVKGQYFGDEYYVVPFKKKTTIRFAEMSTNKNLYSSIKEALASLYRGDDVYFGELLINDENRKIGVSMLLSLMDKHSRFQRRNQLEGIGKAKEEGAYRGRKPIKVDLDSYFAALEEVKAKKMTPKEAASKLGISIDKYYRLKKEYGE